MQFARLCLHLAPTHFILTLQPLSGCAMMYSKFPISSGKILRVNFNMHAIDECMHCVCLYEFIELKSCLVGPRRYSEQWFCFHVLLQTIGQMVILG